MSVSEKDTKKRGDELMPKLTVKQARIINNISRETVAEALGISATQYARKERGEVKFYAHEAKILCDLFDMKIEDFYFD